MNELDDKVNKLIIITFRNKDNSNYIPAEEVFINMCLKNSNIEYETIKYDYTDNTSFFGRLPILYINGNIITQRNLPRFILSLYNYQDLDFDIHFQNLLYVLRDCLRLATEYYILKNTKKEKSWLENIKSLFYRVSNLDSLADEIISNRENQALKNYPISEKYTDLRDRYIKQINLLNNKDFDNKGLNNLLDILIYSFLKEDLALYPTNECLLLTDKLYNKINKVDETTIPIRSDIKSNISLFRMKFSTKRKEKKLLLQEQEIRRNQYHTIISFAIFVSFTGIIWYLTKRKKNRN